MYTLKLKNSLQDMEKMMDDLINKPLIRINDKNNAKRLGRYAKPLRERKVLTIAKDKRLNETIAYLKCNNVLRPGSVRKKKGRKIEYIFDDLLIPRDLY